MSIKIDMIRPRHPRFWSDEKTKMLLELRAAKVPVNTIAERLGVTANSVQERLRTIGAPRRSQFRWTPEADARLAAYYLKPKSERGSLKVELRSWPESPMPDAAYVRASQLKLTRNTVVLEC